jgi:predicted Zn-dependent protease
MMKRRLAALALALFPFAAAAQTPDQGEQAASAPIASPSPEQAAQPPLPPQMSRPRPAVNTDEGGLWGMSDRAENDARASGQLERDPALNAYVREVVCRVADRYCGDVRLYLMNRPYFNASMAPNGYMEVWSGLLLRAEDEAQLAFVLGHEVGHYGGQHTLAMLRTLRGRTTAATVFSLIAVAAGAPIVGDFIYLGAIASFFGFSREQESEADVLGFDSATAAGYDPHAGERLWNNLLAETKASDNPDVRRSETRGSIFRTHPLSADRVESLAARAAQAHEGETHRERYRAAIRPFLDDWLRADIRRRDYGQTLLLLDRLGAQGEDLGVIEYFRGEVYRIRRNEGDRANAVEHYAAAQQHPDAPAAVWRELGEYAARDGRNAEAATLFATYLERAPDAQDRALLEARIAQLNGGGQ